MADENKKGTVPGFAMPVVVPTLESAPLELDDVTEIAAPRALAELETASAPAAVEERPFRRGHGHTPAVDIDLVYERRTAPLADAPWVFVEIWTRNTIYALDARLSCIDVIDQASKRSHTSHALLGARLVGGQTRDGDTMELSHPFPRPGSEAVFEQIQGRQVRFSQTSSVTRVVMRLRVLTVTQEQVLPAWEEVTGSHKKPV